MPIYNLRGDPLDRTKKSFYPSFGVPVKALPTVPLRSVGVNIEDPRASLAPYVPASVYVPATFLKAPTEAPLDDSEPLTRSTSEFDPETAFSNVFVDTPDKINVRNVFDAYQKLQEVKRRTVVTVEHVDPVEEAEIHDSQQPTHEHEPDANISPVPPILADEEAERESMFAESEDERELFDKPRIEHTDEYANIGGIDNLSGVGSALGGSQQEINKLVLGLRSTLPPHPVETAQKSEPSTTYLLLGAALYGLSV